MADTKSKEELRLKEYIKQVEKKAKETTLNAQEEANSILVRAESEKAELLAEVTTIHEEAQKRAESTAKRAAEKEKDLVESAERIYQEAVSEKAKVLKKAQGEKSKILSLAKKEKAEFLKDAKEKHELAVKEYNQKMEDFEEYKAAEQKQLETELKASRNEAKISLEKELAEKKLSQTKIIDQEIEEKKRLLDTYRADYAESWSTAIVFKAQEHFDPNLSEEKRSELREELKAFSKAIINEQNPDEQSKVQGIMHFDPEQRERKKRMFKRTAVFATMGLFILMLMPYISSSIKNKAQEMAKESELASEERIAKVEKERELLKTFIPEKKQEYLGSYTDRVLYTENYVENELDKEYREEWFLNLDTFFVEELVLSDETIVTFISKETNLIKALTELRDSINAQFVDEGVSRMKALEKDFLVEVQLMLKNDDKFDQFRKFKKDYYLKSFPFGVERSLSSEEK